MSGARHETDRLEIDAEAEQSRLYAFLSRLVVPRPIAWVSTRGADGSLNLAPHSYFTVAANEPPTLLFTSVGRKDTLTNIEATGEFVVNLAPVSLMAAVNETSASLTHGDSEFDRACLTPVPGLKVTAPRVAESPASFECVLDRVIEVGDSFLVLGRVVQVSVAASVVVDGRPDEVLLDPLARLGGARYSALGQLSSVRRPT